jgi:hypothetical protein
LSSAVSFRNANHNINICRAGRLAKLICGRAWNLNRIGAVRRS